MGQHKVFKFSEPETFYSTKSEEFANLLDDTNLKVRQHILSSYGLTISNSQDSSKIRLSHDGRKIGIGYFKYKDVNVAFNISPKQETIRLKKIYSALGDKFTKDKRGEFEYLDSLSKTTQGLSNFTPSFLIHLLEKIKKYASHLPTGNFTRKEINITGGIKGRPLLKKSFKNQILGKTHGWYCEVLDNDSLRDYFTCILETAKEIEKILQEWKYLLYATNQNPTSSTRLISSKIGIRDTSDFTYSLLVKLCRPPFPFGLRDIMYDCLKFWNWRGQFQASSQGKHLAGYHGLVIQMDELFDDYVGAVWRQSLQEKKYTWLNHSKFNFNISSSSLNIATNDRSIIPDHIFINKEEKVALIVDAKYKSSIGSREDLFQMISYLDFKYSDNSIITKDFKKNGLIVYPGSELKLGTVKGFKQVIYFITIPIKEELFFPEIADFFS